MRKHAIPLTPSPSAAPAAFPVHETPVREVLTPVLAARTPAHIKGPLYGSLYEPPQSTGCLSPSKPYWLKAVLVLSKAFKRNYSTGNSIFPNLQKNASHWTRSAYAWYAVRRQTIPIQSCHHKTKLRSSPATGLQHTKPDITRVIQQSTHRVPQMASPCGWRGAAALQVTREPSKGPLQPTLSITHIAKVHAAASSKGIP